MTRYFTAVTFGACVGATVVHVLHRSTERPVRQTHHLCMEPLSSHGQDQVMQMRQHAEDQAKKVRYR